MLDIFHTVSGLGLRDGGPSRSVPAIADAQTTLGCHVTVIDTLFNRQSENGVPSIADFVGLERMNAFSKRLDSVVGKHRTGNAQPVMHDHGLWLGSHRVVWKSSRRMRTIRIVSPRGMLSPWALNRNKFLKRCVWHLWQRKALKDATAFHATSFQEEGDIRSLGFTQPIAVVPNGVTIPAVLPLRRASCNKRTALFLSRVHPKKGLLNLVQAWHDAAVGADWKLVIAGPDDGGHKAIVSSLVAKLNLVERVEFQDELDDNKKWQAYVDADLFILPSLSENFGIVIAEAMVAGLPVITTTATPWKSLRDNELGWWVEPDAISLAQALRQATVLDPRILSEKGQASSKFARANYTWDSAAEELVSFYRALLST